jgi:hypothetical protein
MIALRNTQVCVAAMYGLRIARFHTVVSEDGKGAEKTRRRGDEKTCWLP